MTALSGHLLEAIQFATNAHRHQRRKNADADPYIGHPIEVMTFLSRAGVKDHEILMAAVLHDTIEDTGTKFEELSHRFGHRVATLVQECTDDKSLPKVTRKKLQIEHVRTASLGAQLIKLADKYSNTKDLFTTPPLTWSSGQITGYVFWSYAVCDEIKKVRVQPSDSSKLVRAKLNMQYLLDDLFHHALLRTPTGTELHDELERYYALISAEPERLFPQKVISDDTITGNTKKDTAPTRAVLPAIDPMMAVVATPYFASDNRDFEHLHDR